MLLKRARSAKEDIWAYVIVVTNIFCRFVDQNQFAMSLIYLLLVFCVFCSLFELVHSQSFPYVSFLGETLANHSYVNLSLVGSSEIASVRCHTDLSTCCSAGEGIHRGDWYFPDGTRLPFFGDGDVYEYREARRVDLRSVTSASSPAGMYRCDIPTNAVHDDTDISVRETVYVGLFPSEGGKMHTPVLPPVFFIALVILIR